MLQLTNVNYKGWLSSSEMRRINFHIKPYTPSPHQVIIAIKELNNAKLLVFPSGKCRLMGMKRLFDVRRGDRLPVKVNSFQLQSASAVINFGQRINLIHLAKSLPRGIFMYEPELFPALRLTIFNPLCVNVFSSGKIVILGLKETTNQQRLTEDILGYINTRTD